MSRRPLSAGDAGAVAALLLFIVAWVAGWTAYLELALDDTDDIGTWSAVFILMIVGGPAMWAGRVIDSITRHDP